MTNTEIQILDATIKAVSTFGMRKTSMSDIAALASVSRQTVYNLFGTKDRIYHSAIIHMGERWRSRARSRLNESQGLSEQLDVLFDVFAVQAYEFSHASPASTDMFVEAYNASPDAMAHFINENRRLFEDTLRPYAKSLSANGVSLNGLAAQIDLSCRAFIREAQSLGQLMTLVSVERALVLNASHNHETNGI